MAIVEVSIPEQFKDCLKTAVVRREICQILGNSHFVGEAIATECCEMSMRDLCSVRVDGRRKTGPIKLVQTKPLSSGKELFERSPYASQIQAQIRQVVTGISRGNRAINTGHFQFGTRIRRRNRDSGPGTVRRAPVSASMR